MPSDKAECVKLVKHWLGIFGDRWARKTTSEFQQEMMKSLTGYKPRDLEAAFRKAFEECEFYPGAKEIIDRVVITASRGDIAWIPPVGGNCCAAAYNGRTLITRDNQRREMRCACPACVPWAYTEDGRVLEHLSARNRRETIGPA